MAQYPRSTMFGTDLATLRAQAAQYTADRAASERRRIDSCMDDDCFVSQKVESQRAHEFERALELAAEGWRWGFVGLCWQDGTPAKGRWVSSKFSSVDNWMAVHPDGRRVFVPGEVTVSSRSGCARAIAKLEALGLRWESRRLRATCGYVFPDSARGFEGLWSGSLATWPVDENGKRVCDDALVYAADEFFFDGAAAIARGLAEGRADEMEYGEARLAELNAPRVRRSRKAA